MLPHNFFQSLRKQNRISSTGLLLQADAAVIRFLLHHAQKKISWQISPGNLSTHLVPSRFQTQPHALPAPFAGRGNSHRYAANTRNDILFNLGAILQTQCSRIQRKRHCQIEPGANVGNIILLADLTVELVGEYIFLESNQVLQIHELDGVLFHNAASFLKIIFCAYRLNSANWNLTV